MVYEERIEHVVQNNEYEVDDWVTWKSFLRDQIAEGLKYGDAAKSWQSQIEDPGIEAKYCRGQWLLPQFRGIKRMVGGGDQVISGSSRSKRIDELDDLKQIRGAGLKLCDEFFEAQSRPKQRRLEEPAIDANPLEQPTSVIQDTFTRHIEREVSCWEDMRIAFRIPFRIPFRI